jgi:hypothetical protein
MAKHNWIRWAGAVSLAGALVVACESDKTDKPSNNLNLGDDSTGGTNAKGGAAATGGALGIAGDTSTGLGGAVGEGGANTTAPVGVAGASVNLAGAPNSAGAAGASSPVNIAGAAGQVTDCVDAVKNCYKCVAASNQQILNHCTDAKCVPFDNKTLTKLVNGQLPALP